MLIELRSTYCKSIFTSVLTEIQILQFWIMNLRDLYEIFPAMQSLQHTKNFPSSIK